MEPVKVVIEDVFSEAIKDYERDLHTIPHLWIGVKNILLDYHPAIIDTITPGIQDLEGAA